MKKLLLILTLAAPLFLLSAFTLLQDDNDLKNLVVKIKEKCKWGAKCKDCGNSPDTFTVCYVNTSARKLDILIGVQEDAKWWRTAKFLGVAPKDTVFAYACKGTGKSLVWARAAADESYQFPNQQKINEDYPK